MLTCCLTNVKKFRDGHGKVGRGLQENILEEAKISSSSLVPDEKLVTLNS
jgi:hypothetical protein